MLTLYLLRHAKSSWDDAALNDFDRPLNERGYADAPEMGKRLRKRNALPDLILTSPAARALATSRVIASALDYPANKINSDKRIYHADASQLLTVIKELNTNDSLQTVMIFGHNPGFTEFANQLFNEEIDNIPTCGVVAGELNIQNWNEIRWGCGEMRFFDYPKK